MKDKLKHQVFEYQTEKHNLKLSNENFGQELHKNDYDPKLVDIPFPNDYTLALFSELAYVEKIYLVSYLKNWKVLTRAINSNLTNRYKGTVFWNPKLCHVVIAHQGTTPKSTKFFGDLISDIQLALKYAENYQAPSAATLVYRVVEEIKKLNKLEGPRFKLSITGHSLGAWLAQYTTFTAKFLKVEDGWFVRDEDYLNNIHPHTVVFDCPGCHDNLEALLKKITYRYSQDKFGNYKSLDMTVYLNKPNWINTINKQVGVIYLLPIPVHDIDKITALFESQHGNVEKEVVLHGKYGLMASIGEVIKPQFLKRKNVETREARDDVYSLNTFTEYELEFIKDLWQILIYKRKSGKNEDNLKFLNNFALPQFELNYEKNIIKCDKLKEFVAKIKNLRPTKVLLFNVLKKEISGKEVLKMENRLFEKKLITFNNYHFIDIYNLAEFFKVDGGILHIRVDVNSSLDYEFETSILYNLFQLYQNNHQRYLTEENYCFLKWNDICELNFSSDNWLNVQSFNLVIFECFEIENDDRLCAFLKSASTKVIVLSTDIFSWKAELKTTEVNGFSSNINLRSLTEDSKNKFWNQKIYEINNETLSCNDVFVDEVFEVQVFLDLLLRPENSKIELQCPYSNLMKGVFFESLYRELTNVEILKNIPKESIFVIKDDSSEIDLKVKNVPILKNVEEFDDLCLEELNKTNYLFDVTGNKIFLSRIFNPNYYINRRIMQNKILNKNSFIEDQDSTNDFYVFCGNKDKFKELASSRQIEVDYLNFVTSENSGQKLVEKLSVGSNAHLFKIGEDEITWLYSVGSLHSLYKHMEEKEILVDETDIFETQKLVIISGEPGVGKSSIVEYLYLKLQTSYWVFAIQCKDCDFDFWSDDITYDLAAKFIINSCSFSNGNCIEPLLSYCLRNETKLKVCLMFDSFEGILEKESRFKMIKVLQFLKESRAKILITTRPHLCNQLQNGLSVFAFHFKNLNFETEMKTFFVTFWKSQLCLFDNSVDNLQLEATATEILQHAENVIGNAIASFIGIPMHLRLIAETITPPLSTSLYHNISDVLHLYEKYVKNQCNVYFKKFVLNTIHREWLETCIVDKMIQVALHKFKNLNRNYFTYNEMEELYHVGLIYFDNNKLNCKFSHDSVCDYFTSNCLQQWLTSPIYFIHADWNVEEFLVCKMFILNNFKIIRFFLNCYFKNLVVAPNRLSLCKNKLQEILDREDEVDYVNETNESIVHVCVKENLQDLLQNFLFKIFSPVCVGKLLALRNSLGKTPLCAAIMQKNGTKNNVVAIIVDFLDTLSSDEIKEVLLATLFNHFMLEQNIKSLIECAKKYPKVNEILSIVRSQMEFMLPYIHACEADDIDDVQVYLDKFKNDQTTLKYLLMTTNECKETGLHVTKDLKLAKMLIQPYNLNLRDNHGMTPLARAAKDKKIEIGEMLIAKGAELIPDSFMNTPQMHAAKNGNLKLYKILATKRKFNLNEQNLIGATALILASKHGQYEMVKSLLARKADFSIRERNGYTALFYAVTKDHKTIVQALLDAGSDFNVQNRYGFTPLHVSIKRKRLPMIHCLLDRGANVNIGNEYLKEYPLQILIKHELTSIIDKVLDLSEKNNVKVNRKMLCEEEKSYLDRDWPTRLHLFED